VVLVASESGRSYDPTYREQDVDETLDDHEYRIGRLEKGGLIVAGYGLSEGWAIVTDIMQFF
jgi:hypothetical protein